jgi:serine/threonine protein kinase
MQMPGVVVALCVAVFVAGVVMFQFLKRRRKQNDQANSSLHKGLLDEENPDDDTGQQLSELSTTTRECVAKWQAGEAGSARQLPYTDIQAAPNSFSVSNRISAGASCEVFTGQLFGMYVAVKHLAADPDEWDETQFQSEMELLCAVSHPCICRLFAYSTDVRLCLVLELCTGGSLDKRIACEDGSEHGVLLWDHRMRIAVTIAVALVHLHSLDPPVLHRDVKSQNVLLDGAGNAKVAGERSVLTETRESDHLPLC